MNQKATATLLELAAKCLLSNEPAAIHALGELPRDLFVPLFIAAFLGRHMKVLKEMVRVWPFHCLHIGTLSAEETYYEILEAMVDGLQILPAQNSSTWKPKLRILDLRQDPDCETTCSEVTTTFPFCFQSCVYSQHSIFKIEEAQHNVRCLKIINSESELHSAWEPMELLVDLSIGGTLRTKQFLSFLQSKVEQSFGILHLCCRGLQIDNISADKSTLKFLDVGCIDHLEMDQADLNEITNLLSQMIHLNSLSLSNIPLKSCKRRNFRNFLIFLGKLGNLQELSLSSFCLKNQLHKLLRVLPPQLDTLYLPYCELSNRDVTALSQSFQATHLTLLNLSNNQIFSEGYEPFQILLEKVSGTLKLLELNHCLITDSTLSAVLPALSHCSHLRVLSFVFNPISMPMLMSLLQHLTSLMELKHVIYPVPVHCYEQWDFHSSLNQRKLAEVQAQLKVMLQAAQRDDMNWTTSQ
ncbi:melanoma antigen preferentially expressed in tumors-like [Molossus molossus]|uniref:PRAME nuclear receptor transcriptional regulator n=1 Tax=Molossus molossus TaxID=27622 RepID=A0A7J8J7M0_MOLMO|nr:melanoma antigen preferentially expressed in tumors-like [Molossus molossus]KAF6492833.1 PRAME nuclear receptor transcriptional regulator [Molossus molossus]